jgi:hypothetical protein
MKVTINMVTRLLFIVGLSSISQLVHSDSITDNYNAGDTLTATKMNNIKSAVNDNDTRIDTLETAGLINRIEALEAALSAHIADLENPHEVTKDQVGLANLEDIQVNFSATAPPTLNDDFNSGFSVGSVWIDAIAGRAYVLVDSAAGAAIWKQISNDTKYYNIGDTGPGGGIVFYVTNEGIHGLEAARSDLAAAPWGCSGTVTGASATGIGEGELNSSNIIAAGCQISSDAIALTNTFTFNGFTDWFLPSKEELDEMLLKIGSASSIGNVGGLGGGYWSSSETDAFQAYARGGRYHTHGSKLGPRPIRPVRSF